MLLFTEGFPSSELRFLYLQLEMNSVWYMFMIGTLSFSIVQVGVVAVVIIMNQL